MPYAMTNPLGYDVFHVQTFWHNCRVRFHVRPHQLNFLFLVPSLIKNICFIKIKTQYNFYAH